MSSELDSAQDEILSEINVIPLVDISLVLLIIFMVTANYITASYLNIDLPESRSSESSQGANDIAITVTRDGPIYLDSELVTTKELREKLKDRIARSSQAGAVLNVDKRVDFKSVVAVLDLVREAGIKKVNISAISAE